MHNGVQFDINTAPRLRYRPTDSALVRWVLKYSGGLIKNETQANYTILVFVVVALLFSAYLIFSKKQEAAFSVPSEMFLGEPHSYNSSIKK